MVLNATINSEATANIHLMELHTPTAGWGGVIILIIILITVGLWFLRRRRMRRH
jgi:LPXTG-motif cell wall-anchored protein